MAIFGWDASDFDWPRGPMDLVAARWAGIDFFTHKASEGTSVRHGHYGEAMRRARDAGIPVLGAYHVVRSPANAAAEVDYHLAYVTASTPWWRDHPAWFWQIDLEKWPYDPVPAAEGEHFADIIEARTGRRAIIYASRGQYGNELTGTSHPLWNAHYGINPTIDFRTAYTVRGGDVGPGWTAYSGRTPVIWQYGSRTTIGRQTICDANAYRGSLDQLRALITLGGHMTTLDDGYRAADGNIRTYAQMIQNIFDHTFFGRWAAAEGFPLAVQARLATLATALAAVAAKVDIDPAELAAITDAARAGAEAGLAAGADVLADRIATRLVLATDNPLGEADMPAIVAAVKQALTEGTG